MRLLGILERWRHLFCRLATNFRAVNDKIALSKMWEKLIHTYIIFREYTYIKCPTYFCIILIFFLHSEQYWDNSCLNTNIKSNYLWQCSFSQSNEMHWPWMNLYIFQLLSLQLYNFDDLIIKSIYNNKEKFKNLFKLQLVWILGYMCQITLKLKR